MPLFKKKWKITFAKPIGRFGNKFELEDWTELHKTQRRGLVTIDDTPFVTLDMKGIKAIREAAEIRPDYRIVQEEFHVTDRDGIPVPTDICIFLLLKGEAANLQLLLKSRADANDYYDILAVGDDKIVQFIRNAVPSNEFLFPIYVILKWIDKWTTDVSTEKATGLLIHAGLPIAPEPIVYLAASSYQVAE